MDLEVASNLDLTTDLRVDTLEAHTAPGVDPEARTVPRVDPGVQIEAGVDLGV